MPIEIREVLIRAVVDPQASSGPPPESTPASGGGIAASGDTVGEAVKKVFEMLRDKEER